MACISVLQDLSFFKKQASLFYSFAEIKNATF